MIAPEQVYAELRESEPLPKCARPSCQRPLILPQESAARDGFRLVRYKCTGCFRFTTVIERGAA